MAGRELKQLIAGKLAAYPNFIEDFSDALAIPRLQWSNIRG